MTNDRVLSKLADDAAFVESAASRAHDTISFMCATGAPPWDAVRESQKSSCRAGVRWVLWNPNATPEELHNEWMREKIAEGWVYGKQKNEANKVHPCLVSFSELSKNDKIKDELFIHSVLETVKAYV